MQLARAPFPVAALTRARSSLRRILPMFALEDRYEPRAVYDLLSDPPLPGIDRLRTIIDDIILGAVTAQARPHVFYPIR